MAVAVGFRCDVTSGQLARRGVRCEASGRGGVQRARAWPVSDRGQFSRCPMRAQLDPCENGKMTYTAYVSVVTRHRRVLPRAPSNTWLPGPTRVCPGLAVLETAVFVSRPLETEILRSWSWHLMSWSRSSSIGLGCFRDRSIININFISNAMLNCECW